MAKPHNTTHTNFKVYQLFEHVIKVSMEAWLIVTELSFDENMQVIKSNHRYKRRITYKAEGDGFQCNAICDNGYT